MPTFVSENDTDLLAQGLFDSLTADATFTIPDVDLSGPEFTVPSQNGNALYGDVTRLSEADLTSRVVGGSGIFDGLMAALNAHLEKEFEGGRITGKEYSTAYVSLTTAAMQYGVNFLLSRDSAYWQSQLIQRQARLAEIQAVNARAQIEATKAEVGIARVGLNNAEATYALTKMKLASEDAAHALTEAQGDKVAYEVANILPKQSDALTADIGMTNKQVEKLDYELDTVMPKEVDRLTAQIAATNEEILRVAAQKDQILYQTSALLPAQRLNTEADTSIKEYQHQNVMPAQVDGIIEDTQGKAYIRQFIQPANLKNINEQTEAHRAKTKDNRTDGSSVQGSIGKQKDLHSQQIDSYKRSDEMKFAKAALDTWITQKSIDEGINPPNALTNSELNEIVNKTRNRLGLA